MEKELNAAKHFNKVAVIIIITMLILMSAMTVRTQHWAKQYRQLELKYEELYEELHEEINEDKINEKTTYRTRINQPSEFGGDPFSD